MIAAYRRSGGGDRWFGIDCNFQPTCSAYAEGAIRRFGLAAGLRLTRDRLRRCNRRDSFCKCLEPVPDELPQDRGERHGAE
ncbi:membrane protein insertion efficiency factor YidD [Proteobacteria bacterium 005FR1]|nr:membrane protein insertion efficiency factor YidD [Proteobacteria bacterium 005FR1]